MLIEVIVGSAILLTGIWLYLWARSPALRDRIEQPKHDFVNRVRQFDTRPGPRP